MAVREAPRASAATWPPGLDSRDAPHLFGLGLVEMLADEMTTDLRAIRTQAAEAARNGFMNLGITSRDKVLAFLQTLVLFPPDDTASNLDPGDPNADSFPQRGHGSIALTVLFNNPADKE